MRSVKDIDVHLLATMYWKRGEVIKARTLWMDMWSRMCNTEPQKAMVVAYKIGKTFIAQDEEQYFKWVHTSADMVLLPTTALCFLFPTCTHCLIRSYRDTRRPST